MFQKAEDYIEYELLKVLNNHIENKLYCYAYMKTLHMLKEFEGIGITSYKKLFNYFYSNKKPQINQQLTLFDI